MSKVNSIVYNNYLIQSISIFFQTFRMPQDEFSSSILADSYLHFCDQISQQMDLIILDIFTMLFAFELNI